MLGTQVKRVIQHAAFAPGGWKSAGWKEHHNARHAQLSAAQADARNLDSLPGCCQGSKGSCGRHQAQRDDGSHERQRMLGAQEIQTRILVLDRASHKPGGRVISPPGASRPRPEPSPVAWARLQTAALDLQARKARNRAHAAGARPAGHLGSASIRAHLLSRGPSKVTRAAAACDFCFWGIIDIARSADESTQIVVPLPRDNRAAERLVTCVAWPLALGRAWQQGRGARRD